MGKLDTFRKFRSALRDPARIGDAAVYKSELGGMRARDEIEAQLLGMAETFPNVDVAPLLQLPRGTVGREYAELLARAELQPFRISEQLERDVLARNIFIARYALVHDIFHVLTGFDTSWAGEAGVWAFVAGQRYTWTHWLAVVAACFVYPLFSPLRIFAIWGNVRRGAAMGRRARPLIAVPFELRWEESVESLRKELKIVPVAELTVVASPAAG